MYARGYDQNSGNYLQQSTYPPQHHYYPPQPTNQSTSQSNNPQIISGLRQSSSGYQQHHQQQSLHGLNQQQSIHQNQLNNPFVLPSYIQPHQQHQFAINEIGGPSRNEIDAAQSLLNHSSSSKRASSHQTISQSSKSSSSKARPTSPVSRRTGSSKQVTQSKSPVKSSKRKRDSSKKSRKRKSYSSDSSSSASSSDSSSEDESSSSEDEDDYDYRQQNKGQLDKNQYHTGMPPMFPQRIDHRDHSDDDDDGADSDSLSNWTCPPYTEDMTALHESFQALMNHWKPEQKRAFERRRREIMKAQLKNNINRPDVTFIALLRRAAKIHASLAPDKYKIERDLIVSLFASELPRQLTMSLFDLSAWTFQRIVTATQDGENVAGFLEKWKSKIKAISTTNPDGSVSVHYSSKTRNRTCKLTGRTMKEEKEIAEKYYTKPENANKDIIAIYAEYLQDMTGGDKTKRAPLSRANFYQLAPEAKKRKAKPEVLRLDCENCKFPIRLRVEEEEIITKLSKKKKVKRLKGAPLDLSQSTPGAAPLTIVSTTIVEDKSKKDKDKDKDDLYETVEVVELVDGPPKKRIKVEMLKRDGTVQVAAREVPATASTKSADPKKKRLRTSTAAPSSATAAKPEPVPPQLDQHGNPIYTKRGPGRPRKSRADANLTQQMLSILDFLPAPVSTLSEQEKQQQIVHHNQQLDPDRIRGFISQLHETGELPQQ